MFVINCCVRYVLLLLLVYRVLLIQFVVLLLASPGRLLPSFDNTNATERHYIYIYIYMIHPHLQTYLLGSASNTFVCPFALSHNIHIIIIIMLHNYRTYIIYIYIYMTMCVYVCIYIYIYIAIPKLANDMWK